MTIRGIFGRAATAALLLMIAISSRAAWGQAGEWSAAGTLLEACTCAVPCTCNFGEGPSPHSYCHPVFAYRLDKANWNGMDLSGLIVAGADGPKGQSGFLDARATPEQRPALEQLAKALFAKGGPSGGPRKFTPLALVHEVKGNALRLDIAGHGGFSAQVIVGRDSKSPVVVENNTVWPIARAIKAKTAALSFQDATAGTIQETHTNANYGAFAFREMATTAAKANASDSKRTRPCCEAKTSLKPQASPKL